MHTVDGSSSRCVRVDALDRGARLDLNRRVQGNSLGPFLSSWERSLKAVRAAEAIEHRCERDHVHHWRVHLREC
jgi:hypothetical protein